MVNDVNLYWDAECSKPADYLTEEQKMLMLYKANKFIKSDECEYYDTDNYIGLKVRAYCDKDIVTFKHYNLRNEDPKCVHPYPETAYLNASFTAGNGDCVRLNNWMYASHKIGRWDDQIWANLSKKWGYMDEEVYDG